MSVCEYGYLWPFSVALGQVLQTTQVEQQRDKTETYSRTTLHQSSGMWTW
jgi:hypothetical protein